MALIDNPAAITVTTGAAVNLYANVPQPSKVDIQNLGPNPIFLGGPTVTAAKGVKIFSGGDKEDTAGTGEELWAISSGGNAEVRIMYDTRTPEAD
jgi:hypothetical protein